MTEDARQALAREQRDRNARLGLVLIGLGILGILWGVFHILESVPKPAKREFAYRTTDFQARSAVHGSFAGGLVRALAGLGVAVYGARVRRKALGEDARET